MRLVNYYTLYAMWPICAKIGRGFSVVKCFMPAGEKKIGCSSSHLTYFYFVRTTFSEIQIGTQLQYHLIVNNEVTDYLIINYSTYIPLKRLMA